MHGRTHSRRNLLLTFDFPPSVGGVQQYYSQLFGQGGIGDVTVLTQRLNTNDAAFDETFPGEIRRLRGGTSVRATLTFFLSIIFELPRRLSKPYVLHVGHVALAPALIPFFPFLRGPIVVWCHALELTHPAFRLSTKVLLGRADRVVVVSEYTRRLAIEAGARPEKLVKISPGGDNLAHQFQASSTGFRQSHAIGQDEFFILSVSRVSSHHRYKGFDRVVEVAQILIAENLPIRWVVVGDGNELDRFRDIANQPTLDGRINFLGRLDDESLAQAYAECDLFCLLSRDEHTSRGVLSDGFGIVYVQAGSFGKPVVGLRRGGVPDAVLHEMTGVLVDNDDAADIAAAIRDLVSDPVRRHRLGENGRARALGAASWATARDRLRQLLASL